MSTDESRETVIVLNPESGRGNHVQTVQDRAEQLGYALKETAAAGDAITFARDAAEAGASTIVAAGGDGTVNEVVRGIDRAEAFDSVTVGIFPVGTGNNFAKNLGIPDLDTAFDVLENGERRRIDLGLADDRPFLNSCVAGLTADSSSETSREMKARLGELAYVITTLRSVSNFDAHRLTIDLRTEGSETEAWSGEALSVLVGNGRRFTTQGSGQANMEDGRLDVTIVEDVSTLDLMSEAVAEQLLGEDAPHLVRAQASGATITIRDSRAMRFSLDGEIVSQEQLSLGVRPRTLEIAVGDAYDPTPY